MKWGDNVSQLISYHLSLKSLKHLLIRNFLYLFDERRYKEKLEYQLQKLNEKISGIRLKFSQRVVDTVDNDGNPLYSNETKRTIARKEMESTSKYFQSLISKKASLQKELSRTTINFSNLINLRIALNSLVLLATVEPNLFKIRKKRRRINHQTKEPVKFANNKKNSLISVII